MNNKNSLLLSTILFGSNLIFGMENDQKEQQVQKKMKLDLSMPYINDKNEKTDKFECFFELPVEIQVYIIKYLNFMDIKNFRLANKELKVLISDKDFNEQKKIADKLGLELMHTILHHNNLDRAKNIIKSGDANLDIQGKDGETSLILASTNGFTKIAKLLIDAKVNLNLQYKNGTTALIQASLHGNIKLVKLLIDAKAILDMKENNGSTALYLAYNDDIECILKKAMELNNLNVEIYES